MTKEKQPKHQEQGDTRRNLLIGGGAAVVAGLASLYISGRAKAPDEQWPFLHREQILKHPKMEQIEKEFVPFGLEQDISYPWEIEELNNILRTQISEEMARRGFDPSIEYVIEPSCRYCGLPDEAKVTKSLADYCRNAAGFMQARLRMEKFNPEFTILTPGSDFENDFNGRVFIGNSYCFLRKMDVINPADPGKNFSAFAKECLQGGMSRGTVDKGNRDWWYGFVAAGEGALTSAFSEILHRSTMVKFYEHMQSAGFEAAQADEAVVEGIAYILSSALAKELKIPDGAGIVRKAVSDLLTDKICATRYKHLPSAVNWMNKNGIQNAYDLYMQDPQKFMDAIKKS